MNPFHLLLIASCSLLVSHLTRALPARQDSLQLNPNSNHIAPLNFPQPYSLLTVEQKMVERAKAEFLHDLSLTASKLRSGQQQEKQFEWIDSKGKKRQAKDSFLMKLEEKFDWGAECYIGAPSGDEVSGKERVDSDGRRLARQL